MSRNGRAFAATNQSPARASTRFELPAFSRQYLCTCLVTLTSHPTTIPAARGACDVLASIVKRLLQLHPVLHESRAYTSLRQHLVQMFSRGEMERRNWSKLICRNIGDRAAASLCSGSSGSLSISMGLLC